MIFSAVPSAPNIVDVDLLSNSKVLLKWMLPDKKNGELLSCQFDLRGKLKNDTVVNTVRMTGDSYILLH